MPRAEWEKKAAGVPEYEGVRVGKYSELGIYNTNDEFKIETILNAMEQCQLLVFEYSGFSRVVAPFIVGVSSEGNPLVRGYQLEGKSRSGKGAGWRVYKFKEMANVEFFGEYFVPEEYHFDPFYPWVYKVYKMIA